MSFSPADGLNFVFELGPQPIAVVGLPKWAFFCCCCSMSRCFSHANRYYNRHIRYDGSTREGHLTWPESPGMRSGSGNTSRKIRVSQ